MFITYACFGYDHHSNALLKTFGFVGAPFSFAEEGLAAEPGIMLTAASQAEYDCGESKGMQLCGMVEIVMLRSLAFF